MQKAAHKLQTNNITPKHPKTIMIVVERLNPSGVDITTFELLAIAKLASAFYYF